MSSNKIQESTNEILGKESSRLPANTEKDIGIAKEQAEL